MNKGVDYTYPLPPARLHARYDPVFAAFKRGQSCTIVGLPLSSRSAYFKFILSEKKFLKEFINSKDNHFIILEGETLDARQILEMIRIQLIQQGLITDDNAITGDPISSTLNLQFLLSKIEKRKKIIIIIYEASSLLRNSEVCDILIRIWNINRTPPNSLIQFCFIDSERIYKSNLGLLNPAVLETRVDFPLFTKPEMEFTRRRLEFFSGKTINSELHNKAFIESGGHYLLYKSMISLPENQWTSSSVKTIVTKIFSECPLTTEKDIPLLKLFPKYTELTNHGEIVPQMSAQQRQVFDLMCSKSPEIITRDEIAQTIWGPAWQTKYSDWAIDKLISHLKRNLKETGFVILALRNRGYKFIRN